MRANKLFAYTLFILSLFLLLSPLLAQSPSSGQALFIKKLKAIPHSPSDDDDTSTTLKSASKSVLSRVSGAIARLSPSDSYEGPTGILGVRGEAELDEAEGINQQDNEGGQGQMQQEEPIRVAVNVNIY